MTTSIESELEGAAAALPHAGPSLEQMERFARRAARAGLVDVAYTQVDSPLGPLTLAATERGLVTLAYPERSLDDVLARVSEELSPRVIEAPAKLDKVARELDQYFRGKRERFDTPIDWTLSRGFFRKVLEATARIGYGEVSTYAGVARAAGNAKAVRAAGNGLGSNPLPVVVPCHRVLRSGGKLGGYTGGLERKEFLLELERR
jgi:methylated-DNA-[protein]-cysteine S-methyltransferase